MNFPEFIVSYKYLDKSFPRKKIFWALNYLKKIANKYKIDILLNKPIKDLKKNYIFLFNNTKTLKQKLDIKINIKKNKEFFIFNLHKYKTNDSEIIEII